MNEPESNKKLSRLCAATSDFPSFQPAYLHLASGERFSGYAPTTWSDTLGEVVFNTGMGGYAESLTDPSYAGQILTFTYPLMGNYGVGPSSQWESHHIQAQAAIFSECSNFQHHHNAQSSLPAWLESQNIPYLVGVDTRALTKALRKHGVVSGILSTSERVKSSFVDINTKHLVKQVSCTEIVEYGQGTKTIIAIDCGMKENIVRCLQQLPVRIKRVPFDYDFSHEQYDGVFVSNGPGDPALCVETIAILKKVLEQKKPIFGICLGAQLLALAIGAKTYKLPFGHRGQNHPCLHIPSGRSFLTSQNHGYAIDEKTLPKRWEVMFRHLHDETVAGIRHEALPFFAVQFHPEAHPGPLDTQWLFQEFYALL